MVIPLHRKDASLASMMGGMSTMHVSTLGSWRFLLCISCKQIVICKTNVHKEVIILKTTWNVFECTSFRLFEQISIILRNWPSLNCLFSAQQHICYSALYASARPFVRLSVTPVDQSKRV